MKPGSLRPMVILVIILDVALIALAAILYYEFGVGQLPCHTDMECEQRFGADER